MSQPYPKSFASEKVVWKEVERVKALQVLIQKKTLAAQVENLDLELTE